MLDQLLNVQPSDHAIALGRLGLIDYTPQPYQRKVYHLLFGVYPGCKEKLFLGVAARMLRRYAMRLRRCALLTRLGHFCLLRYDEPDGFPEILRDSHWSDEYDVYQSSLQNPMLAGLAGRRSLGFGKSVLFAVLPTMRVDLFLLLTGCLIELLG